LGDSTVHEGYCRSPHGSCCGAYRLALKEDYGYGPLTKIGGDGHRKSKSMRRSSAVKRRTCTRTRKSATKHRAAHRERRLLQGILDRTARQVRAKVMPDVKRETLQAEFSNR